MSAYPGIAFLSCGVEHRSYNKKILVALCILASSMDVSIAAVSTIYGGPGGNAFTDTVVSNQQLTGFNLRSGSWIDSIQGVTNFGVLPAHGGIGGTAVTASWPANEYLVRAYGTYNASKYVGQISFVTNSGRVLGPYGSPVYPTITKKVITGYFLFIFPIYSTVTVPDYSNFDYTAPAGKAIVGFAGRSGALVDAIGFIDGPPTNVVASTFLPTAATACANDNSICTLPTGFSATVYYGANGKFAVKKGVSGSLTCNVATFNGDPIYGVAKSCSYVKEATTLPAGAVACANENATCTLPTGAISAVYYGANGKYVLKDAVQGSINCNNTTFGDPISGAGKTCSYVKTAVNAPDLSVSIAQPAPALVATALSEIPVTVTNQGTQTANAPISLTLPLPAGVVAPAKFARNVDAWTCLSPAASIVCTYTKALPAGVSTTIRLPVKPLANTVGSTPGSFIASVAAVAGETNTTNNSSPAMTSAAAVQPVSLPSIVDPSYSNPLLDPTAIPKYAMPLTNLASSFFVHTPNTTAVPGTDLYNLAIKQINSQILPPGFPSTAVYAYGDPAKPETFSYPSHSIVANSTAVGLNGAGLGKPVKIQFSDTRDPLLAHLLPVDHSIHGAMAGEPDIRSVTHLHGIKNVNQISDGYPEGWSSPTGQTGNQFTMTSPTVGYNPNPFDYPNNQEATLMWFHDHSLGMTRLNVYAGLAGAYLLRDSNEQAMISNNSLPNGAYEIPLVLQDKAFKTDGSLAYPDKNPAVAGAPANSIVPEFYGNVMLVNGVSWPFLDVEPRKYRFRVLNGSSSRFYKLALSNNASFQVIGTEGGFLAAPTTVTNLTMAPAERYDVIVDFSTMAGQTVTVTNAANSPFPNGVPVTAGIDDQIMQFRVNQPLSIVPNNPLPASLRPGGVPVLTPTVATPRRVLLAESTDNNGRILPVLGTVANGLLGWMDTVTETPVAGSIETWEIFNDTVDAHPIHLHGGHFQVVDRYNFSATVGVNHALTNISYPSAAVPASAQEKTWKDTVISYPGQVTRIKVKFDNAGLFVWHCHILEHEDHDMMRPMLVQ